MILEEVNLAELARSIAQLLKEKQFRELKTLLEDLNPIDIAEVFDELEAEACVILFRLLKKDKAAEVFSYASPGRQKDIVGVIHVSLLNYIIDELCFDDKIDFLEEMPANFVKRVIATASPEERGLINQFLNFKENSAGSLMTIEYVHLKKNMSVRQALDKIKSVGMEKETVYTCYVLDDTRDLEGIVSLRRLVLSDDDLLIADIMTEDVVQCETGDDQEDVAALFKKYGFMALPVVDAENRMVGIITIDDIVDVIEQENTEDFQKMAAVAPSDEAYMITGPLAMAKRRFPWLLILMISATLTESIIGMYEELISTVVVLAASIPLLMGTGGNAGSQASCLIVRGIALGEVELRNWPRIAWKELRVSLLVGVMLAIANALRMMILGDPTPTLLLTVNSALIATIVMAKIVGCTLPILAKTAKVDPAVMATPLITTIVDAMALVIFFGIATALIIR